MPGKGCSRLCAEGEGHSRLGGPRRAQQVGEFQMQGGNGCPEAGGQQAGWGGAAALRLRQAALVAALDS